MMTKKPGEKALEAMKKLSSSITLFKIPKVPPLKVQKNSKTKILTEEQYIEELGKIIQREFFPHLEKLKAQNQYLDAIEKNDVIKIRELYAKYSGRRPRTRTGFETPATFETPIIKPFETPTDPIISGVNAAAASAASSSSSVRSHLSISSSVQTEKQNDKHSYSISDGHTLDSFLTHYTSEDNNSFQEIIEVADKKLRQRFAVLYDAENEKSIDMAKQLQLPDIEQQFHGAIDNAPQCLDTWTYKNKNYIMYVPDGVDLTIAEQMEMAKRKQEISHRNTRLQSNPFGDNQIKNTNSNNNANNNNNTDDKLTKLPTTKLLHTNKIGVDGNTIAHSKQSPQVRGFGFVKTPSPCPGIDDSPLMTWGEIEGTPFRLDAGDTPIRTQIGGPSFRIAETSRRENIALELAEKAGERMRGQKAKAIEAARRNMASPYHNNQVRSTLDRLATMSPAAKRLATARLGVKEHSNQQQQSLMSPSSTNRQHKNVSTSITLTPKSAGSLTPTSPRTPVLVKLKHTPDTVLSSMMTASKQRSAKGGQTNKLNIGDRSVTLTAIRKESKQQNINNDHRLTDDLLNIPLKRKKASDFF